MLQQCFGRQNGCTASKNKLPQPIDLYYLFFSFFLNILRVVQIFFRKEPCTWSVSGSPKRSTTVALQMVNARGECFCQMSWSLRGDSLSPCMVLMCVFFFCQLYMYQMFRSLAYIHSVGICHRDIKPQNLLLDPETAVLKLCDFGR